MGLRYLFPANGARAKRRDHLGVYPGLSLYDARERARGFLRSLAAGRDPRVPLDETPPRTLGELADLFARDYLPRQTRPSTQREWTRLINVEVKPLLGDVDPARVREARASVRLALERIVNRGGGETANRVHVVTSRIVSWAVSRDLIDPVASAVFVGLEKAVPARPRTRVLSDDEIRKLWPAIQQEAPRETAFWELAFRTGRRRGEMLGATFDQFATPQEWRFVVKGGREHWLGLPSQVDEVLARLRIIAGKSAHLNRPHDQHAAPAAERGPGALAVPDS